MDGHQYTAQFEAPGGKPVLLPYLDTLGIPTVGLGHTGPDVIMGEPWSYDRCMATFYSDYAIASGYAPHILGVSVFSPLSEPRKSVIIDLCFDPGPTKLVLFHRTLKAIRNSMWEEASKELLSSKYAQQVKGRADANAQVLLTGAWPGEALVS